MSRKEMKDRIKAQQLHNDRVRLSLDSALVQIAKAQKDNSRKVWIYVLSDTLEEVQSTLNAKGYNTLKKEEGLEVWGI